MASRPRDPLEAKLRNLAEKLADDALGKEELGVQHDRRVETLKILTTFANSLRRGKGDGDDEPAGGTFGAIKRQINHAEGRA